MPTTDPLIERLRTQRHQREERHTSRNLFIRNVLNILFILIAIVAMIGIMADKSHLMVWYAVGLFAVLIKMVEVMLRMPGLKK